MDRIAFVLLGEVAPRIATPAHGWGLVCVGNVEHSTSNVECEKFDSKFDVECSMLDVRFIS